MTDLLIVSIIAACSIVSSTIMALFVTWNLLATNKRLTNAVMARDNQEYKELNSHDLRLESRKNQAIKPTPENHMIEFSQMSDEDIQMMSGYNE